MLAGFVKDAAILVWQNKKESLRAFIFYFQQVYENLLKTTSLSMHTAFAD